jgi:hypothetical protein
MVIAGIAHTKKFAVIPPHRQTTGLAFKSLEHSI